MRNRLLLSLICILNLWSCSSHDSKRRFASDDQLNVEDNYNWVDSLNFDKKTETKYQAEADGFKANKDETSNSLINESISTLSSLRLEEQLQDSRDPLSKIVIQCYQRKMEDAFNLIDKMYSQYKNNTSYWNQVGTCYYLKGDFAKAILFYNKSRDLDPKFNPPINNLGVVYQKQGRYQKALSAYNRANDMSPFAITPAYNQARLYLQFGVISKAGSILLGMYKKNPKDTQLAHAVATYYLIKGDYANSISVFSSLPKDQLSKPEIGLNYALALKLNNKRDEAKSIFSSVGDSSGALKVYAQKVESFIKE